MMDDLLDRLKEWALDKASTHHRLAHENKHLRTEHVASSSAYKSLADKIESLRTQDEKGEE